MDTWVSTSSAASCRSHLGPSLEALICNLCRKRQRSSLFPFSCACPWTARGFRCFVSLRAIFAFPCVAQVGSEWRSRSGSNSPGRLREVCAGAGTAAPPHRFTTNGARVPPGSCIPHPRPTAAWPWDEPAQGLLWEKHSPTVTPQKH